MNICCQCIRSSLSNELPMQQTFIGFPSEFVIPDVYTIPNTCWMRPSSTSDLFCRDKLSEVELNKCFIVPKHTLGSNQLQIQQRTCNYDRISQFSLFTSACSIMQIREFNHITILGLTYKQQVACPICTLYT